MNNIFLVTILFYIKYRFPLNLIKQTYLYIIKYLIIKSTYKIEFNFILNLLDNTSFNCLFSDCFHLHIL